MQIAAPVIEQCNRTDTPGARVDRATWTHPADDQKYHKVQQTHESVTSIQPVDGLSTRYRALEAASGTELIERIKRTRGIVDIRGWTSPATAEFVLPVPGGYAADSPMNLPLFLIPRPEAVEALGIVVQVLLHLWREWLGFLQAEPEFVFQPCAGREFEEGFRTEANPIGSVGPIVVAPLFERDFGKHNAGAELWMQVQMPADAVL